MLLRARSLTKSFSGLVAVSDFDFELQEGVIGAVIGPNGAGKTTFLNMLSAMVKPDAGTIEFAGREIQTLSPVAIARSGIARTFQNIRLFPSLTVLDHLLLGSQRVARGIGRRLLGGGLGLHDSQEIDSNINDLLALLDLSNVRNKRAAILPYGAQRRVELARALSSFPRLLLLDEPTAGMLPSEADAMVEFLRALPKCRDVTILMIEHNMRVVTAVADHVTVLHQGRRIADGKPQEVLRDDRVVEAYLGRKWSTKAAVS